MLLSYHTDDVDAEFTRPKGDRVREVFGPEPTGLTGADLLGTMLARHPGSVSEALTRWEQQLRPSIDYLQGNGMRMRSPFVPATRFRIALRRAMLWMNTMPLTSTLLTRWRAKGKAGRMRNKDFAHPGPAEPVHVHV